MTNWLWHPFQWAYHGLAWTWGGTPFHSGATGYNIVSGDLSNVALIAAVIVFFRKHNCHVNRCWRLSWHNHEKLDHPVCKRHIECFSLEDPDNKAGLEAP